MTEIIGNRRGFIAGALAFLSTPSIVRADSLMKISGLVLPKSVRWIMDYEIHSNRILARCDFADFDLVMPKYVDAPSQAMISLWEKSGALRPLEAAWKYRDRSTKQQMNVTFPVSWDAAELMAPGIRDRHD